MLLRASGKALGSDVDVHAIIGGDASGVDAGPLLVALAEASVRGGEKEIRAAREALLDALGWEALVDAAGTIGNFERMVRIADGTGIPIDAPIQLFTEDLRDALGLEAYQSSAHTPRASRAMRWLGRVLRPLQPVMMRRYKPPPDQASL